MRSCFDSRLSVKHRVTVGRGSVYWGADRTPHPTGNRRQGRPARPHKGQAAEVGRRVPGRQHPGQRRFQPSADSRMSSVRLCE